jgi:hypothetical protein
MMMHFQSINAPSVYTDPWQTYTLSKNGYDSKFLEMALLPH